MDLHELKSQYQHLTTDSHDPEQLRKMLRANQHPVLKGIRLQLLLEGVFWTLFLLVYYDFFDGHLKPFLWNLALVGAVAFLLVHTFLGYQISNRAIYGTNIRESLQQYLSRIRKYARISIGSRVLAIITIMGFFLSTVPATPSRYGQGGLILLIISVQIYLLYRIWAKRINRVQHACEILEA